MQTSEQPPAFSLEPRALSLVPTSLCDDYVRNKRNKYAERSMSTLRFAMNFSPSNTRMGSMSYSKSSRIILSINETYLQRESGFNHKLCSLNPHPQFPRTRITTSMDPTFATGKKKYHPEASIATLFFRNSFSETTFAVGTIRGSNPLIPML